MAVRFRSESPALVDPLPIRRLQESVINRIAAGEIIHRPVSALKELIENSLDAGSTAIRITIKDGGLKLLQIQDNGCGIRKDDLPILAERFTTSKLSTFSDLSHLTTYGFRGEALASISYVSNLTVITKTKGDSCAWKACYQDGSLISTKAGTSAEPKACAGNDGTTITAENLFYNTPTRLSALRSSSEEYARILDVVTKYAVHNPKVSFTCKKWVRQAASPTPDISTPSSSTTQQTIRLLYGQTIAKDILHVGISSSDNASSHDEGEDDDSESWSAESYFTNANFQAKKMVFLLFINHRLVESSRIKKAIEAVYNGILPKGASPFVYLSLLIDPRSVDVNVHPTKKEVHFLNEDAIIERISDVIQETLIGQSQSRTLLTGGVAELTKDREKIKGKAKAVELDTEQDVASGSVEGSPSLSQAVKKKTLSKNKVRTSLQDRTLDSMFPILAPSQQPGAAVPQSNTADYSPSTQPTVKFREIKESQCYLTSVRNLRQAVRKGKHHHLSEILEKHTFVGIVDLDRCLSLIQHSTKLYLVNHGALSEELFYQLGLRQFGNYSRLRLDPPPPLRTLVTIAVDAEDGIDKSRLSKPEIIDCIVDTVMARRNMLQEYFSMSVSAEGLVESIPLLLGDYTPNLDKLPLFLMRLGPQVNWTSEMECFDTFLRELAFFYVPEPLTPAISQELRSEDMGEERAMKWQVQHVLFPAISRYLVPPKTLLDRDVVQVADLPDLYRVFERC
ncbi:DNA mismatch repair protein Mlh1 [Grifola frondosa]|uniref:DNA mismatch repair protein Mlh1 n=1 Tax=Grifola frondosa TaxID=5627 RepID=A0A1C7MMP4_GRIFR|nr:DNA mismatch repair protein Mlh1 [Grifola frondosa]